VEQVDRNIGDVVFASFLDEQPPNQTTPKLNKLINKLVKTRPGRSGRWDDLISDF
jgi:hypothetical protein